jgi:hypothetical protein
MLFTCSAIGIQGQCQITGAPGDSPAGWTLGLIQLKWIDTDWAYYRGQSNNDGSSFLQMARPPALTIRGCRDTIAVGGIFVDNNPGFDRTVAAAGAPFPIAMSAAFGDAPGRGFPLTRVNGMTGKTNFLHDAQTEIHFCTVLSLQSPAGVFQHLRCVYWNVHWQGSFMPTNFGNIASPWTVTRTGGALGNSSHVSPSISGGPAEPKFTTIITAAGAPNCNAFMRAAFLSPNVKESAVWSNFDVTR